MLDPQLLRRDSEKVAKQLLRRNYKFDVDCFTELEADRRILQGRQQELQTERNQNSKEIGRLKAAGADASAILEAVGHLGKELDKVDDRLSDVQEKLGRVVHGMPNIPHDSVPDGSDETQNLEVRRWGSPREFDFDPLDHVAIGECLNMMSFDKAAKISGSRFVVLSGQLCRLQRALTQFMLDLHTQEHGYQEVYVPFLVSSNALFGTGQLPKFEEDQFRTDSQPEYYLIPTAEVPVTNLHREEIIDDRSLPLRYVCHTPCFRREAGSYGRDTRGMIRQHQFEKVELVNIVRPSESWKALEALTNHAEIVLQRLELPYRVITLCAGDLGFSSAKTYDIEVWLPGQNAYREISSCSNFMDFQARRMQCRWRNPESRRAEYAHTLNGSGLAVGRTLVAIMENCQNADGSINVPSALRPYLGGVEAINRPS
ncbi:MAG: serine--tRNA ligase [Acidiferrobacteraceae bacterium]|nr:serine--tRNA ligase [Acidiferrobacteraceae bacterium]